MSKSKNDSSGCLITMLVIFSIIIIGNIIGKIRSGSFNLIIVILIVSIPLFFAIFIIYNNKKKIDEAYKKRIKIHIKALSIKRKQLLYKDDYGKYKPEKWTKEIYYFLETVAFPDLKLTDKQYTRYGQQVEFDVVDFINAEKVKIDFDPNISPTEYENYCALLLREQGWKASATKSSGDQGIDVVASKNGKRLVLQCKLYNSGSVGNKAVQEISAGRVHERADYSAVVTNAAFTESAKQLANTNDVMLLHHDELNWINDRLL